MSLILLKRTNIQQEYNNTHEYTPTQGKATLIGRLFEEFPNEFSLAVSHTSRAPMPEEQHGVSFFFTGIVL
jgi:hypothetical protein